jgi:hypothetical protein
MKRTTDHRTRVGTALGAFALLLAAGCGTEVASAPAQLEPPEGPKQASPNQQCHGSPQYGGFVCQGEREDEGEQKGRPGQRGESGLAKAGSGPEGWT